MKRFLWLIPSVLLDIYGFYVGSMSESLGTPIIVFATILFVVGLVIVLIKNHLSKKQNQEEKLQENSDDIKEKTDPSKYVYIKVLKGEVIINPEKGNILYKKISFKVKEIEKYYLVKNEQVLVSSGIGEAIAGGILFGGAGAIAGAYIGSKEKVKEKCFVYVETNNIEHAGIAIAVTEESGFKLCKTFDLLIKQSKEQK